MSKTSIKKNFVYNLATQVLNVLVPLLTTPYLARVLHETGNGIYSYSYSIITYFILFANLGFNSYGQREIAKTRDNIIEKSRVFWEITILRSFFTLASFSVLISIVFTIGFGSNYNAVILTLSIQVFSIMFDINFFYQGEENFKAIAIRNFLIKSLGLICVFVFVKTEDDVWIYALCLSLVTLFSYLVMWPSLFTKIRRIKVCEISLWKHIKPAMLFFLPTLAITIYVIFDKTMIGLLSNNPDYNNGCYEQAYKINTVGMVFISLPSTILGPRNAYEYQKGNYGKIQKNIRFSLSYVWMIGLPLIAGFLVLSDNICFWFLGEGYAEVPLLLRIMSLRFFLSGFSSIIFEQIFVIIGKEKYMTIATSISCFINVILNLLLIPEMGAVGAAITTTISEVIVLFILLFLAVRKKLLTIKELIVPSWRYLLSTAIMFFIIFFIQANLSYSITSFLVISVIGMIVYFVVLLCLKDNLVLSVVTMIKTKILGVVKNSK